MKATRKSTRPFLLRMAATGVTLCMIPLLCLSAYLYRTQIREIYSGEASQLEIAAEEITNYWDKCLLTIEAMQLRHQTSSGLREKEINRSPVSESAAIDTLYNLLGSNTFLKDAGIIRLADGGSVYLSRAKHDLKYYAELELGLSFEDFSNILLDITEKTFLPWNEQKQCAVCIYPETSLSGSASPRYGIYVISKSSLDDALGSLLPLNCAVDRILDKNGTIIYANSSQSSWDVWNGTEDIYGRVSTGNGVYYRALRSSSQGYQFFISKQETSIMSKIKTRSQSIASICILVAVLCILLALIMSFFNYLPIGRAVRQLRDDGIPEHSDTGNEINLLLDAYNEQKGRRKELESRTESYQRIILDRIYKCLLGGRVLTNDEYELLHWQSRPYCVIVCDQIDSSLTEEMQSLLLDRFRIRSVIMQKDKCTAFVAFLLRDSREDRQAAGRTIFSVLNNPNATLGISKCCTRPEDFHSAYIDGILTMQRNADGGLFYAEDNPVDAAALFFVTSFDTLQLVNMLRRGDENAVEKLKSILESHRKSCVDDCVRKYTFYQKLAYVQDVIKKSGSAVDELVFARISGLSDEEQQYEALYEELEKVLISRRNSLLIEKGNLEHEMVAYVEQFYCNADFGLDQFADRFGLNVSTASREFKRITGKSFTKYITDRRIQVSRDLLFSTQSSVSEIARQVGFSSDSYFIKVFKETEGITPAQFRANKKDR